MRSFFIKMLQRPDNLISRIGALVFPLQKGIVKM